MFNKRTAWLGIATMAMAFGLGCSDVCDTYCEVTVDKIVELGCMTAGEWNTSWDAQGYEDSDDYLEHCQADKAAIYQDAKEQSDAAAADVRQTCSDKLDEASEADSCGVLGDAGY